MPTELKKTIQIINEISPSFCAAKWYNATIWLGNGRTASCHLPLAHSVPLAELSNNYTALHNTEYKKQRRLEMLNGIRCDECAYCWTVEDSKNSDVYSDRIYKTRIYNEDEILHLRKLDPFSDVNPKTLEISFDNLCNLSCSYCNAEFSTTWSSNIKEYGVFENMKTSGGHTYKNSGEHALPYGIKNENNPYIDAFFKWFDSGLKDSLQELRVTGGEPSRSPWFWKLLEKCDNVNFDFAVNSNMIMDTVRMQQLIDASKKFKTFDLYTSGESFGRHASFVRAGLDYNQWKENIIKFAQEGKYRMIHIMMTISALSIWSVTEFMTDIIDLRKKLGTHQLHLSVNILRFPSFQNLNVLPAELKLKQADKIDNWLALNHDISPVERNQIVRLSSYLRTVERSYEDTDLLEDKVSDFVSFTKQYATRINKNIDDHFPVEFLDWFKKYE